MSLPLPPAEAENGQSSGVLGGRDRRKPVVIDKVIQVFPYVLQSREIENISRGSTFGVLPLFSQMQDVTVASVQSTGVQTPFSLLPPLLNSNVGTA